MLDWFELGGVRVLPQVPGWACRDVVCLLGRFAVVSKGGEISGLQEHII